MSKMMATILDVPIDPDTPDSVYLARAALKIQYGPGWRDLDHKNKRQILTIYENHRRENKVWRKKGCLLPSTWEIQEMMKEPENSDARAAAISLLSNCFDEGSLQFAEYATVFWRMNREETIRIFYERSE